MTRSDDYDRRHQGLGYGSAALRSILDKIRREFDATVVLVAYQDENEVARSLYESFGFDEYGIDGTKVLAKLELPGRG